MKKITPLFLCFIALSLGAQEVLINRYEYWFNQHTTMEQTDILPVQQATLQFAADASTLPDGLNSFSMRFRDTQGSWSAVMTRFFVKLPTLSLAEEPNNITGYEYRFNNQPMNWQNITPGKDITIEQTLGTAELPDGLNTFTVRFKDIRGSWSSATSSFFVKVPALQATGQPNDIQAYQVWFNQSEPAVQGTLEASETIILHETISADALPQGLNTINLRFRDTNSTWSSVLSRYFVKQPIPDSQQPCLMTAYEYWLEDAQGNVLNEKGLPEKACIELTQPENPMLLELSMDLRMIPHGDYFLMFRFLDTRGSWSSVLSRGVHKEIQPHALFGMEKANVCASEELTFSNLSIDADAYLWDFGDGNTSTEAHPVHSYDGAGSYEVKLTAIWSETSQEHTSTGAIPVVVHALPQVQIEADEAFESCQGESIILSTTTEGGYLWSTGQTSREIEVWQPAHYWVKVTDANGCSNTSEQVELLFHPLPQAGFTLEAINLAVTLNNLSEGAASYQWDFGDGTQSQEEQAEHQYAMAGSYEICLTATSAAGCQDTQCNTYDVVTAVGPAPGGTEAMAYPVPFHNHLTIELMDSHWQNLQILSSSGKRMYTQTLDPLSQIVKVNTESWPPGAYVVILKGTAKEKVIKVIKKG